MAADDRQWHPAGVSRRLLSFISRDAFASGFFNRWFEKNSL